MNVVVNPAYTQTAVKPGLADKLKSVLADLRDEYVQPHSTPWIIGFSGGKDSTLLAQLVFEMLLALPPRLRTRRVHVVANDTLVESPVIASHLQSVLNRIAGSIDALRVPVTVAKTVPDIDHTFWVNLIGAVILLQAGCFAGAPIG